MSNPTDSLEKSIHSLIKVIGSSATHHSELSNKFISEIYPKIQGFKGQDIAAEHTDEIIENYNLLIQAYTDLYSEVTEMYSNSVDVLKNFNDAVTS